jgi:hypothetical protein
MILVALSSDGGSQLAYTFFDGALWSMWAALTPTSTESRNFLSGYAPGGGVKPALVWTQAAGTDHGIGGLLLP